ncbi:MAG TPA: Gfo/Idh/MocA family oxidoreductase [Nitrospirota bacterium]|nr:Gfo/Idh/MocA family oxidoreductase [Nitrospirota bacterium]
MKRQPGVAIIGCGLIGKKRAKALGPARLIACSDMVSSRAQDLAAAAPGATAQTDWRTVIEHPEVDIVIVATTVAAAPAITMAAVKAGKHVLVEKPAARDPRELVPIMEAAGRSRVLVRVGFNHRYHAAMLKAFQLYRDGALGEMMFVRGRYGHGGRIGYEREWRADPRLSGGGELIDQGVHLIDLSRMFLGEFTVVCGFAHTYFWNMPVDDNGFMLLKTEKQQTAFLHVSCTEWKNLFSFEIYGKKAKLQIDGLGGSYGVEKLTYYKMLPQMGPPETVLWEFPGGDESWANEFMEFLEDIRLHRQPSAGLADANAALSVVEKIYQGSGYDHNA